MTSNGIMPDPSKVKVIKDFPEPKTLKDLRGFLGLSSYYRKFIKGYANIASVLTDITRGFSQGKGHRISIENKWGQPQRETFQKLKQIIIEDVTLAYPDFSNPFCLATDASDIAKRCPVSNH